jgi:hypothetical protein
VLAKKALELLETLTKGNPSQPTPGGQSSIVIVVTEQLTLHMASPLASTPQPVE